MVKVHAMFQGRPQGTPICTNNHSNVYEASWHDHRTGIPWQREATLEGHVTPGDQTAGFLVEVFDWNKMNKNTLIGTVFILVRKSRCLSVWILCV